MSDYIDEHVMISRADLARILMKAKGFDPDKFELVNMDLRSTAQQHIYPVYMGKWTDSQCPIDLLTFGVKKKGDVLL
jgi:hypothetical protein